MLEKFTPEEVEQIKKELGLKKPTTTKEKVMEMTNAGKVIDTFFPYRISGIRNAARQEATKLMHYRLADAILGNYVIREKRDRYLVKPVATFVANNAIPEHQVQEYIDVCNQIAQFLDHLWQEHAITREANIENAIKVWESNQNKEG